MSGIAIANNVLKRASSIKSGRMGKFFLILVIVLSFVLLMEIIFHLIIAPRMVVRNIEISSDSTLTLSDESVLRIAGITGEEYFFSLRTDEISANLQSYPIIKEVTAEKIFPDTLHIKISQRKPVILSLIDVEGETVPVALDEDGFVIQIGETVNQLDLPVLSGLVFPDIKLGQRVNRLLLSFLVDLKRLKQSSPALFNLISEVKLVRNRADFEGLLFLRGYDVKVRIGASINEDLMKDILLVLDVFRRDEISENLAEIDFRTDEVITRFKEG